MSKEQFDKRGEGAAVDKADRWIEIQALSAAIARLNRAPTEVESALCGAVVRARDWFEELEALKETASVPSHARQIEINSATVAGTDPHVAPLLASASSTTPQKPVAFVPLHPRTGPLWANTVPSLDADRPAHYATMPLFASPVSAIPRKQLDALRRLLSCIDDHKGHGLPTIRDRAECYAAMQEAEAVLGWALVDDVNNRPDGGKETT